LIHAQPGSFLLNVALSALALVVPLFLATLAYAVAPWTAHLDAGPELSVFVALGTRPDSVEKLQSKLAVLPGARDVRLIPRDEAYAELARRAGLAPGTAPRANPLPDVLVARFEATTDPDAVERSAESIRSWPLVDSVRLDLEWHRRATALVKGAGAVLIIVAGLSLLLVGLVLVAAARVQAESRYEETAVLLLAGARPSFLVRPYAYAGAITLGLGATLAVGLATAAMALVEPRIAAVAAAFGQEFRLAPPPFWLPLVLVGAVTVGGYVAASVGAHAALAYGNRM
jgi:cell division transport system permease protein